MSVESNTNNFLRPKTRGELFNKLKEGIKCEVVASNEEITSICINSLIILNKENLEYKTYPSTNFGWVIYESVKIN